MPLITLPRLQRGVPVVDNTGKPTGAFVRYWNLDFTGALERTLNDLAAVQATQAAQQAALAAVQATQAAEIARLNAVVFANQQTTAAAQAAQQAANNAQMTADEALADGTVSGSALDPAVTLTTVGAWVTGPQVDLTSVLAGNLRITGTGPQQDAFVYLSGSDPALTVSGEYRVQEIDGGIETTVFVGAFSAFQGGSDPNATISNDSAASVASFNDARTSTGAISYRVDARILSGNATIDDLDLYVYARRTP